ncbi:MAG: endonuclease MutS2, partial [bacterium]
MVTRAKNNLAELYESLEFDKILSHLQQFAISELAREKLNNLAFGTDHGEIEAALSETAELQQILDEDAAFPLSELWDIRAALETASVEGNLLTTNALVQIAETLITGFRVRSYLHEKAVDSPRLWLHAKNIRHSKGLIDAIRTAIDFRSFEVQDSASPQLRKIRRRIVQAEMEARKAVNHFFKAYSNKGYLQDQVVTLSDGRLVLPVKWEHKGKVQGLVHGQSAKGSTIFMEPFDAVELNNEILRLKVEETREIQRILQHLTDLVRVELEDILQSLKVLAHLDFVQAKARFARQLNCSIPEITREPVLEIVNGRHPLLLLREETFEDVVPLNLSIGADFHSLIISGPNTGGKTVALKTVGLLALMLQSGIPIPADPDSKLPVFEQLFVDVGDLQSIEQDLSTFSAHLGRIRTILENANDKSLVLIDEIGAGTDPDEGSALAIAILEKLTEVGSTNLVTTHLGTLKAFADSTAGVANGSMQFDLESLRPRYEFRWGIPGSSYAIEIADRLGVSRSIIARARELLGSEKGSLEQLLLDLEDKIQEHQNLVNELDLEKTKLAGLTSLYKEQYEKIKKEETALKEKAILDSQEILNRANAAVEQAIKEIREKQAEHGAIRQAKEIIRQEKTKLAEALKGTMVAREDQRSLQASDIKIGEQVFWKKQNSYGTVVSAPDASGKILLVVGNFKFRVSVVELFEGSGEKPGASSPAKVNIQVETKSDVLPEIDLRGQTLDEAVAAVDKFLDDAILAGWQQVRLIHGKGTGRLR